MTERGRTEYRPSSVSPPGDTLAALLEDKGLTQAELARRLDRPIKTINEIVKGKAAITPDTAVQLERALGAPADFWLARECAYREWLAREKAREELKRWAGWLRELPVREMSAFGWIKPTDDRVETVSECLKFFGVASVEAWRETYERPLAAFRASTKVKRDRGAVAAWLRRGELDGTAVECAAFDAARFESLLPSIRALTLEADPASFVPRLTEMCREAGVAVVFARAPRGCPASGAARWLNSAKPLIQLSVRYRTNDQLWFTFFHEAAHILRHRKTLVFVDEVGSRPGDDLEAEADAFARDVLVPPDFAQALRSLEGTRAAVVRFAARVAVAPGIVVGRMQNEGLLPWSHLNDLKAKYVWAEEPSG
jgi:addiction module HigA family antidote